MAMSSNFSIVVSHCHSAHVELLDLNQDQIVTTLTHI